jgi:BCD family chlorophyll transporter-like MFS transporter
MSTHAAMPHDAPASLGWFSIVRIGLVQTALGAIVVLTTSTVNRIMVVELAMPAMLPGALVALHYTIQLVRPRLGYGSDVGGRRTPWIVGGMAVLALGGVLAAVGTAWMTTNVAAGIALALIAYALIGCGVGASGTSLLVLLAQRVDVGRRAAASAIVWIMMIVGFIVTAAAVGAVLDPYSPARLVIITAGVSAIAFTLTVAALYGIERRVPADRSRPPEAGVAQTQPNRGGFRKALLEVWQEPRVRRFASFVFVSMLAYSAQDLILEPFAGLVFGMTPGESTSLAGIQNGGVLCGMLLVALAGSGRRSRSAMRPWTIGGCVGSAAALFALVVGALVGPSFPLEAAVFCLGFANGVFAISAIAAMMGLVGEGRPAREGVRTGVWGAAQAVAFGLGGFLGTMLIDIARWAIGDTYIAYASVFAIEGVLFLFAASLAMRVGSYRAARSASPLPAPAPGSSAIGMAK